MPPNDPPMAPDDAPAAASGPSAAGTAPPGRKRSGGTAPSDLDVATFSAARGFLAAEWFGACLMVASFTLLYLLAFGAHARPTVTYAVCMALLAVGTLVYLRSRAYYGRLGSDIAPRSHAVAAIVAGSAGIFWLLFAILLALAWAGVAIL